MNNVLYAIIKPEFCIKHVLMCLNSFNRSIFGTGIALHTLLLQCSICSRMEVTIIIVSYSK
jgi:hypothetical protein